MDHHLSNSCLLYLDELAVGVAVDCVEQSFYWTDVSGGRISRANVDGFGQERVASGKSFWNTNVFFAILLR